jgi:RimJ/RimL family protein N-acetyltransferase
MGKVARIETDRLLLREQLDSDAATWGPMAVDPEFRRYVPWRRGDETPVERATRALGGLMRRWDSDPLTRMGWVIARRSDGQLLGTGGIEAAEDPGDGELDYFLGKPFWGQGYGREAAHAMARYALDHTAFRRLVAYIVPGNEGSIRIAEGLGMRFEKEVDYMAFFPDPSVIELSSPLTWMYAVAREDISLRDDGYRVVTE